ncbi:MAG: patatin family protein [Firmicutes bacterium]|nr:patatin family protein [Bacillota bacterium]
MLFAQPVVKGEKYTKLLPQGTALVLEGGGTRGFYSAGVLEAFMDAGIMFPYIIGVSAGAANAISYISGQKRRNRMIIRHYVCDKRYVSRRNLLRYRSLFGYDFIFETVPNRYVFFDRENFDSVDIRFLTGAINCTTGETVWFEKNEVTDGFTVTRASCSVPLIAKIVKYNGLDLLDGGVSDPIPIEKSVADGNNFHVIVLTRNQGYRKEALRHSWLMKIFYNKYPRLVEAMVKRHENYNRQLELCEQLEQEKKAIIIRPQKPVAVDRTSSDIEKLLALHDDGHIEGAQAVQMLKEHFGI